ncbi:unnamed protein product [Musa acuminata subsp. malaccensis]|uniref:(wild Malaysian banana) hypothetical protein n=1 Tax=Musa acuminata subsp. malaccensis TaxID=214687 RepID=A0A804L4Z8_MUSAM|nr:unnamed protein product [Musa acuminata subsp. malaccensis]
MGLAEGGGRRWRPRRRCSPGPRRIRPRGTGRPGCRPHWGGGRRPSGGGKRRRISRRCGASFGPWRRCGG